MSRRLRIAVLTRNFSVTGGGAERYAIALVEQLAQAHEIHVFAQRIEHEHPGVTYHRIPMPMERPRWINQLYFAWATWRATRTGFDIVHSHENTWHGNVQTVHVLPVKHTLFAGKSGVALALRWLKVVTSPRLLAYLWLEKCRYAWGLRKQVVCASESLKSVLQSAYPRAAPMLAVVTPGVDTVPGKATVAQQEAARRQLGLPVQARLLLFVGNDFIKKGLPTLLQAMARLPQPTHLAVVGSGEAEMDMRSLSVRLGVSERVHFLGSQRDMGIAYCAADMLVHPTLEDAYGMVVLEAMAHGLPAVVSGPQWCGIAAELQDGRNALVLSEPKTVTLFVAQVERLLEDSRLFAELQSAGMKFAFERTWSTAAKQHESLFQRVAGHV